jgi:hypothetical protein
MSVRIWSIICFEMPVRAVFKTTVSAVKCYVRFQLDTSAPLWKQQSRFTQCGEPSDYVDR